MSGKTISQEGVEALSRIKKKYPDPKSAVMPALYIAQEEIGVIDDVAIKWVSDQLGISPVHVMELASFYTMYYRKPVGKYHVQVCRTLSCGLRGSKKITQHLKDRFDLEPGEVSEDGMWSYEQVECLGSCGTAPMCEINDCYFENLTTEKLDDILNQLEKLQPNLRYSTKSETLGEGLKGHTKSEIR
jgi:NADH-quinone oxidoreductase E subunit